MNTKPHQGESDPNSLSVPQAAERIAAAIRPVAGIERVALRDALDRVLARDAIAPMDMPPYPNAAMDGYALRGSELAPDRPVRLTVVGSALAGRPFEGDVGDGQCLRITTGAVVPDGLDTVLMQEHVTRDGDVIEIPAGTKAGQNLRPRGDEFSTGGTVLAAGRRINAADLGLLASLGIAEVDVRRRPLVAFFSTGDELRGVGQTLAKGQIYDSNRYTLHALLRRANVNLLDMGVLPDDRDAVREAFRTAAETADAIVTSGGVSVGDADYVKEIVGELGHIDFWRIAMKPGKPLAFGRLGRAFFFGLPGNPVSTVATFMLFARPALDVLAGATPTPPLRLRAVCTDRIKKAPGRTDYQRGILTQDADGRLTVSTTGGQGSHMLSSMSRANCFIVVPLESGDVAAGTELEVMPFSGAL
ncbi:MAG: molybdopterin molybdotransferase MoeA [Ectothiorhodospiraceae bacterium]|jgi:molybdopterin molybdotransferase|nr:molybdopterin molybdotransferase MoeA [Ectothiorhodospiraceae bacterium]